MTLALVPVLMTPPAVTPVSLAEAKAHLSVDVSDWDGQITAMIGAATRHYDGWGGALGRCLVNQTWRIRYSSFSAGGLLRFPFPDVSAVTVKYYGAGDGGTTLSTVSPAPFLEILPDAHGAAIRLKSDFSPPALYDRDGPVAVDVVAGFGATGADVPEPLRRAILLVVGHLWENRSVSAPVEIREVPMAAEALSFPFRHYRAWLS